MHTNIRIQRYTYMYIHAYMHEFIHKNKPPPPLSHRSQTKGKVIIIQSGYFYNVSLSPLLLRGAGPSRGGRGRKKFPGLELSVVLTHGGPPRLRASNKST